MRVYFKCKKNRGNNVRVRIVLDKTNIFLRSNIIICWFQVVFTCLKEAWKAGQDIIFDLEHTDCVGCPFSFEAEFEEEREPDGGDAGGHGRVENVGKN